MELGIYNLLNTKYLQEQLRNVQAFPQMENAEPAEIAKLMSRAISDDIEKFLYEKFEEQKATNKDWVQRAINEPCCEELNKIIANSIPINEQILTELKITNDAKPTERPTTPITDSELIVPNGRSPQLGNELKRELKSCDGADWLVSFIKLKGVRGIYDELLAFCQNANPDGTPRLRIATTTYMGASDFTALDLLFSLPNTEIKICFNSSQTRLHAKAYIFRRNTAFGSAYIGSANLSSPALNSGLEWTIKVSQQEIPHLWERSISEFECTWNNPNFELCTKDDLPRIKSALNAAQITYIPSTASSSTTFASHLHIEPHHYQQKMLNELCAERTSGKHRHLIVSATGTGKTFVAAFDFAQNCKLKNRYPRLLFLVHRSQILHDAREKYRLVMGQETFGAIIGNNDADTRTLAQVFCTVQSWRNHIKDHFSKDYFDLIVMDECHHSAASSYTEILNYYKAEIDSGKTDLLGLTATPFRSDGVDIRPEFGGDFTHELSLAEAIENNHIVPFTYFGIADDTDYTDIDWRNEHAANAQIEQKLLSNATHYTNIIYSIRKYIADISSMRAIVFCSGIRHASAVQKCLTDAGIVATVLSGNSSQSERDEAIRNMEQIPPKLQAIVTADLFNEGVDIPCVNTEIMLRPTNSPLIFVQQLGRGLRKAPLQYAKDDLLVLDFVGNHNANFNGYLQRFRAITTQKYKPILEQIEKGMPFLPAGCAVTLTHKCREHILNNVKMAMEKMRGNALLRFLVETIRATGNALPLRALMESLAVETPTPIYRVSTPSSINDIAQNGASNNYNAMGKSFIRLAQNDSPFLLSCWQKIISGNTTDMTQEDIRIAKLFLLTSFDSKVRLSNVDAKWEECIASHRGIIKDLKEFLDWRLSTTVPMRSITFASLTSRFLELHRTYDSGQIAVALGRSGTIMSGTDYNKERNLDTFFITRTKDEKYFSETTRYDDYAKSPTIFHWQTPSRTTIASSEGQRYINNSSTKMLFIRNTKQSSVDICGYPTGSGITQSYTFLGPVKRVISHEGERPISFDFELAYQMPAEIYDFSRGA